MTKTSVDVDRDVAAQAAAILGTSTLKDTIHASLLEVVNARRRLELVALLADPGRFDFDVIDDAWGGGRQVARAAFLADTSAFTLFAKPAVVAAVAPLIAQGQVALCRPVMFELGYSARNETDHRALRDRLAAFERVPVTDGDHRRGLEVQELLVRRGQHRNLSLVDALVAAVAEARGLTILHYDRDFEAVAMVTGQPHRWVVPAGSAD